MGLGYEPAALRSSPSSDRGIPVHMPSYLLDEIVHRIQPMSQYKNQ
jgi:hypothetical protein